MADGMKRMCSLDTERVLSVLNRISILAGLSDEQLRSLFRLLQEEVYEAGETIFEQGSQPSHIYVVLLGKIKLVVDKDTTPLELIVLETGVCFGESSVIGIQPHSATAIAVERTELIVLSRIALLSLYKTDLELYSILVWNIAREVCRRLHASEQIMLHYVHRK